MSFVEDGVEFDAVPPHPARRSPPEAIESSSRPTEMFRLVLAEVVIAFVIFPLILNSVIQSSPYPRLKRILETELHRARPMRVVGMQEGTAGHAIRAAAAGGGV